MVLLTRVSLTWPQARDLAPQGFPLQCREWLVQLRGRPGSWLAADDLSAAWESILSAAQLQTQSQCKLIPVFAYNFAKDAMRLTQSMQ